MYSVPGSFNRRHQQNKKPFQLRIIKRYSTPGYLAREILERWPAYCTKCDLWSVRVILFLLFGGYLPFEDDNEDKVIDQTCNGSYEFHPHYFGKVSNEANKELVMLLLTINLAKRASAQKEMDHIQVDETSRQ